MPGAIYTMTGDSDTTIGKNGFTTGKSPGDQFQPDYHI
jgi:hypothetical protein